MLADISRDDCLTICKAVQLVDHSLRLDHLAVVVNKERMLALPRVDLVKPGFTIRDLFARFNLSLELGKHLLEHHASISDYRNLGLYVLADARWININVNDLCLARELIQLAGDAIIEACPDRNDQIARIDRHVRPVATVHSQHPKAQRMTCRECSEAHQRARRRQRQLLGEKSHLFVRPRGNRATSDVKHGTLGLHHRFNGATNLSGMALERRLVAAHGDRFGIAEFGLLRGHVFRHIDQDWPGTPAARYIESFLYGRRQVFDFLHKVVVLRARSCDARQVCLLKRVIADQMSRHLTGEDHNRNRIHEGIRDSGDSVCASRAGSHKRDSRLAGCLGITCRGKQRALFVTNKVVLDPVGMTIELVVNVKNRTARIAEDVFDSLASQRFDQYSRATHFHCSLPLVLMVIKIKAPARLVSSPGPSVSSGLQSSGQRGGEPIRSNRYRNNLPENY